MRQAESGREQRNGNGRAGLFTDEDAQALAEGPFRGKDVPPTPRRLRE